MAIAAVLAGCPGRHPDAPDGGDSGFDVPIVDAQSADAPLFEIADSQPLDSGSSDASDANGDVVHILDAPPDVSAKPDVEVDAPPEEPATVRIVAGNLTSGSQQSYTPGHGIRIFQGLHPDIVLLQEFNYGSNTPAEHRSFVDMAFGTSFEYWRGTGDIPNGVISRYHIVSSGDWVDPFVANRAFSWARINVPGRRDLWAVSLHLLSSSATSRANEASIIVSQVQATVPIGDLLVIGGDLNTESRAESCVMTLGLVVQTASPYPSDQAANTNTNSPRSRPYDWLLSDGDLLATEVPVVIGTGMFARGLVFDSRAYTALGDVAPVMATDSAASGMQHMAVVRDFLLGL